MGDLLDGGIDGPYNETDPYAEIERLRSRLDQAEADRESYKDQMIRAQMALYDAKHPARNDLRLVILESPYAGDIERNVAYARLCVRDSLSRGEAPIASHLLYTQPGILRDELNVERQWGIDAGLAWGSKADATVFYVDLGISHGMEFGIAHAKRARRPVERRQLCFCGATPNSPPDAHDISCPLALSLSPSERGVDK